MLETKCVGDGHFGHQHPQIVANFKSRTSLSEALFLIRLGLCIIFSISDDLSLIVPPWQRIDLSSMSSTMSTLDPMALSSHCNRHFDVFFKTKPFYCSGGNILRFESLLKYLNMEWEPGNHLYKDKVSKEFKKP